MSDAKNENAAAERHVHTWTLTNRALRRYRCDCGVIGYARVGGKRVVPYECQFELAGRKHCCKPAVFVAAHRTANRCAEHAPAVAAPSKESAA